MSVVLTSSEVGIIDLFGRHMAAPPCRNARIHSGPGDNAAAGKIRADADTSAACGPAGTGELTPLKRLARHAAAVGLPRASARRRSGIGAASSIRWRLPRCSPAILSRRSGSSRCTSEQVCALCRARCSRSPPGWCSAGGGDRCGRPSAAWRARWPGILSRAICMPDLLSTGIERLRALLTHADQGGWRMVAVVRLLPLIPHSLTNYAFGLTRVRLTSYAIGSLVGQLPLTIAYADLGAAGGQAMLGGASWYAGSVLADRNRGGDVRAVAADPGYHTRRLRRAPASWRRLFRKAQERRHIAPNPPCLTAIALRLSTLRMVPPHQPSTSRNVL